VRYQLKTPWKNSTTHVEFEPVELMARIHVRHPAGDLRSSKSAILPLCHRQTGGVSTATARPPHPLPRRLYYGHPVLRPPGHPSAVQIRSRRICAPNAKLRAQLTPSGRGKRPPADQELTGANSDHRSPDEKRRSMTPDQVRGRLWAQRLKRVLLRASSPPPFGPAFRLFQIAPGDLVNIDVSTCGHCGGTARIVASIEEPTAIRAILAHFEKHGTLDKAHYRPAPRAPPAVAA